MKDKKILIVLAILGYLVLAGGLTTILGIFRSQDQFFFNLATAVILSWIITLIVFYMWAIYYFHVFLAIKVDCNSENEVQSDKLLSNPHIGETLGLPKGTVRGTMALSLLIAGLALLIASFELEQSFSANATFVDNFEFIKTAFLMVIAFYFGDKSIKALGERNQGVYRPKGNNNSSEYNGSHDPYEYEIPQKESPSLDSPVIVNTGDANKMKNILKNQADPEIVDNGSKTEFEDKDAVG